MKPTYIYILQIILVSFISCVGEDIVEDRVDVVLRIDNPLTSLAMGETHKFEATYLNNIGQEENVDFIWSSSDTNIVDINTSTGLATALKEGTAIISVTTIGNVENEIIQSTLQITNETIIDNPSRSGKIVTTSSYVLTGDFVLEAISDQNLIRLSISDNYNASTSLPGLYIYLTNNPNTTNGAFEIGPVQVFNGSHSYDISADEVQLNQYSHVLYFCKPFNVKVGEGEIN
ncbi:hypothetical protein D1816_12020 [Aquimarina sp. AD10]|uniref:Ig-like domain-containing protein n=1 Tax=Aquimarina sp. AD10 TaxID=1714849 RepID=UPI000E53999E|nr:Ig-like domain-containing protein [Aquimarina sp. AD10]AXT61043.1 hypothetical protein D1816_12020 [Aquimarina sp. AD10]RKM96341.1 Ig-like domain-containing protein [Aquimarina sp. AD10]